MNYEKLIQTAERQDRGEVITPDLLVEEMLDKLPKEVFESETTTFLDPCFGTGSFLKAIGLRLKKYGHSSENINSRLFGYEIDTRLFNETKRKFSGINIVKSDFLNTDINMKFDVIIGNPPYSNGLYVQFLNKCIDLLKEGGVMCAIHPSAYIINKKDIKRKDHIKFNNYIEKYKSEVKLVDGNQIFENAGFLSPLAITTIKKELNDDIYVEYAHLGENKKDIVQSVSDIWMHGDSIVKSIFNKVKDKMNLSFEDMLYRSGNLNSKLYLKLNQIAGNRPKPGVVGNNPDFNCLLYKADVDANALENLLTAQPTKDGNYIGINNKKEAKHIYEYSLLKPTRFCLSLYKINSNLHRGELKMVPYLDFSKKWTDEKFYSFFGLIEDEINFIETYIQDYYECDFK